ncbi:MAG: BspA family leucine-rich repeat surface protein [Mogibacterium sp.]|nr:BspA family leucine-rich repeat surface protein [Mogibacterium sp.]
MDKNFIKVDKWGTCLWGIDETGRLFINEGIAGDVRETGVPWENYRGLITEASVIGNVTFPEGSSTAELFKGCKGMEKADLSGFHTEGVTDMHSMFEGCTRLKELDISCMDTTSCKDMTRMFAKCARLTDILLGEKFIITGDGTTSTDRLAIKAAGKYKRARVIDAEGSSVFYHENAGRGIVIEKKTVPDTRYVIEDVMFNSPAEKYVFTGWNTQEDGQGKTIQPGREVRGIDEDIDLYAVWASAPEIGEVHPIPEFAFGEPIPFEVPEIVSANDPMVTGFLEVSPNGEEGTWKAIDHNTVLPVSCSGWLVRLCAENSVGKSFSNPVRLRIRKAIIDMSGVRWAEESDMTYNGEPKHVWVEGLPTGLDSEYTGNEAVEAGTYVASININYDDENYKEPLLVREHEWSIKKASYDMSQVHWDYSESFTYDGTVRRVELVGLPEGVTVTYSGNEASDAGVYTAAAEFGYDSVNFEKPADVVPCVWEIRKAVIDPADLIWSEYEDFVYDGEPKEVHITNLPEDADVYYEGAEETPAGKYLARAALRGNYCASGPVEYEWEIVKASYDMSEVRWDYNGPFTYDKAAHGVALTGVPAPLEVKYRFNSGVCAGDYEAEASFISPDTHNFFTPDDMTIKWSILKQVADMSGVKWNYTGPFTYNGELRRIELEGLPEGVYADYEEASASNAGVYKAHAILKYDYDNMVAEQPADCQWKINRDRIDVSNVRWDYTEAFTYDGSEHGVYLMGLPEGLNVEYTDNVKIEAGKYAASATLTPTDATNFEAPEVSGCTWAINKAPIERNNLEWTDFSTFVYDGTEKTVEIISDIGDDLNVEYIYNKQKNAGRYFAKAIFSAVDDNNFKAPNPVGCSWSISKAEHDMAGVVWDYTKPFVYDGTRKTVRLTGVPEGVSVSYTNASQTDAGDYTAIAKFTTNDTHNYNANIPDMSLDWRIDKAEFDLTEVRWQEERGFAFDGTDKSVALVGLPDGLEAVYTGNTGISASEYVASADFKYDTRNYERPQVGPCRWKIDRSPVDVSQTIWNYEEPFVYDGNEKTVAVVGIPEGAYAEYSNARAVQAGTYIATANIIAMDRDNHVPCKLENLTWRIEKGDYDMSHVYWDYERPFTYDGSEHRIVLKGLPEGVFPTYRNNARTDAGTYTASVSFKIADDRNYRVPTFEDCEWTIRKAEYDMSGVQWNYSGEFKYTGRMHEVLLRGLPDGVRAVYAGNAAAASGSYEASADLIPYDQDNFNKPSIRNCNWQIVKADYEMAAVKWDYAGAKTYNGRSQSVMLEQLPNGVSAEYTGNEAVEVGKYTAKAVLKVSDPANYNTPAVSDCDWEIVPADYNMAETSWNYVPGEVTFDGERKSIEIVGLPGNVSASYEGNSAIQAGDYVATATFTTTDTNFKAPETIRFPWSIGRADCDMKSVRWDYTNEFTYDGLPKSIEVKGLPSNVTVEYENNTATDAGTYTAVARFKTDTANYNVPAPMSCEWVINKADADIRRVRWDYSQAFTYDGETKVIELAGLPDYIKAEYSGNAGTTVGKYTASATLMPDNTDNYNIPVIGSCDWEILKADYDMSDTRWAGDMEYVYDGTEKSIFLEGLPEGVEPVYNSNAGTEAGEYTASAELRYDEANYNKPYAPQQKWSIYKTSYDMSTVAWNYTDSFIYDGTEKSISLTGVPEGLTPVYKGNTGTESGSYEAEVSFEYDERNYEKPVFGGCRWEIGMADAPVNAEGIKWNYTGPFVYDGTPKSVAIAEKVIEQGFFGRLRGKKAVVALEGVPEGFDVVYENNVQTDAGVYYASARLINPDDTNYREFTVPECRWEIVKAEIDTSGAKWNYEGAFTYDGEEKSVELVGLPDTVTVTYTNNAAVNAGEYEALAHIEAADPKNYEQPKPVKGCWWQINKATYDMSGASWAYEAEEVYDGKEKTVTLIGLPEGVRVEAYRGNKAIEAGNYTAEASLDFSNKDNFETPEVPDLKWRIRKKKISTENASWNYDASTLFVYDEKPKEVKLVGLPQDVDVVYIDNIKINAGTYTARARLTYDTRNCEADEIPDLKWTIHKANYDVEHVHWSYDKPFKYDAYEKSIVLRNVPKSIDIRYRDNKASAVGTYTAKAYLTYDSENYNPPEIDTTIDWEIVPRDRD